MDLKGEIQSHQLEDAFQLFNQLSEKLSVSYRGLEAQVVNLSAELAEARSERLKQLAEKELLAKRLEELLDALPAGIVVVDAKGCINQTNPVARDMLGDGVLGSSWEGVAKRIFVSHGDELCLKDGRWVSVSARSLTAESGKIILISDVSQTHLLQEMVSRQQRLTSLGEMIARLAHQIRTPLASALLYLSNMTHRQASADDKDRYVEKIKGRLHHLDHMVSDMLIFARGGVRECEHFDLRDFTGQLEQMLEPQFVKSNARLVMNDQAPPVSLRGNRDALLSAFQNLANNAIEAGADFVEVKISMSCGKDKIVEFSFLDNGCGISADIQERIMEPFFTTRTSGTGLGLAVVNATVAGHHGRLTLTSEAGAGSCFTVTLPVRQADGMLPSDLVNADIDRRQLSKIA